MFVANEIRITVGGKSRSLSRSLEKKYNVSISTTFQYFTTNQYSVSCPINFLIISVGGYGPTLSGPYTQYIFIYEHMFEY